jgi:gliding motility-associated lipoprotein GldH
MRYCLILFSIFIISCSPAVYYSEFQPTSDDYVWEREDIKSFKFTIDQKADYSVQLKVKYLTGFRWDTLQIQWNIKGYIDFQPAYLNRNILMISNGKHIGEASFDIWTIVDTLFENINLKKGDYSINLKHNMVEDDLPYITELGIEVVKK